MSAKPVKNDKPAIAPAPSVLDAVNASRGGAPTPAVAPTEPPADAPETPAAEKTTPAAEKTTTTADDSGTAEVTAALRERRAQSEAIIAATPRREVPTEAHSVDELGQYVTRVMVDARRAASEFLASVDADAARRAASISAQAEIEAASLRAAAVADADKIRADARLEADRMVAQRLRIAIDLTDQLYSQADQILADADRPDVARRNLARFVTALTQTAEDAAAAAVADESRS